MKNKNIVYISSNPTQAALVKSFLEGHGIAAFLIDENVSRMHPFYNSAIGGVKVAVSSSDIKIARKLLKEVEGDSHFDRPVGELSPFEFLGRSKDEGHRVLNFIAAIIFFPLTFLTVKLFGNDKKKAPKDNDVTPKKVAPRKIVRCKNCKATPEQDANFCDQCGEELNS